MSDSLENLDWLLEYTRAQGADAADAVCFESVEMSATQRLGKPEGLERSENKVIGLRAFVGARQAVVSSTDTLRDTLKELSQRAVAMAKAAPPDADSTLAPAGLLCPQPPELDLSDNADADMGWLSAQCREAEEAALSVRGITNSEGADAAFGRSRVSLAIRGHDNQRFAQSYRTSHFSLSVSVLAGEGTGMERDYDFTSARHRKGLMAAGAVGLSASQRALKRLNPRKVATCQVPVVFDPRVGRSLLGAFSGAISGSAVARGASFLKDRLHQPVFGASVSIIDDPHIKGGMGSKPFDGEGVRNAKLRLVDKGVLSSWLLDMRSANKLGLTPTGHAARGPSGPPSPASSNLYMDKGALSPQALIKDIKNGLYVCETFGMGVNTVTGDYSQGAAGFWIENGEIAYPVSEITIAGHMGEMFKTMTPANDLVFRYATNAPTLRVDNMTVAGV